jgi:hypothetical protein
LAVCAIQLNGQTDMVIQTVRIIRTVAILHSSLLIIYIKATMLVFDRYLIRSLTHTHHRETILLVQSGLTSPLLLII